jgi:leucyl/phenylalanyl-tRNA--protein transferase
MAESRARGGPIHWLSPDPRAILPLASGVFHVSRSLRRRVLSGRFTITADRAFEEVVRGCAEPRPPEQDTWIDDRLRAAYVALHGAGHAHSIEAWLPKPGSEGHPPGEQGDVLVGGLYGVQIGGAFFAESKFCRPAAGGTDASKVCLVHLVHHLRRRGATLLDVQFNHRHLERFGVVEIPREEYLRLLRAAASNPLAWEPFEPERTRNETATGC